MRHSLQFSILAVLAFFSSCGTPQRSSEENSEVFKTYLVRPHEEAIEETLPSGKQTRTIFLAGTIDMGSARDWQSEMAATIKDPDRHLIFYTPRQEHWDASKPGEMDYQVNWELSHLEKADAIIMYLLSDSKSPISLLEMGLHARSGKMVVICEPDFYRYDNVRITCEFYGIPLYTSLEEFYEHCVNDQE